MGVGTEVYRYFEFGDVFMKNGAGGGQLGGLDVEIVIWRKM